MHLRTIILTLLLTNLASAAKLPVPDKTRRLTASATIQEIFGRRATAAELLRHAEKVRETPAAYWVLLERASTKAAEAGDAGVSFQAIDKLADTFAISTETYFSKTDLRLARIATLRRTIKSEEERQKLLALIITTAKEAAEQEEFDQALRAGRLAIDSARRKRDLELIEEIGKLLKDINKREAAFQAFERAYASLREDPVNAVNNRIVGLYLCRVRGQWNLGVPMLALSDVPVLKKVAIQELEVEQTPESWVALADAWWALVDEDYKLRAGTWYRQAAKSGQSEGLTALKATRRLKEVQRIGRSIPPPPLDAFVGTWTVSYSHGCVRQYVIEPNGDVTLSYVGGPLAFTGTRKGEVDSRPEGVFLVYKMAERAGEKLDEWWLASGSEARVIHYASTLKYPRVADYAIAQKQVADGGP